MIKKTAPRLIVILGATASGKTRLGVHLARQLHGEIISADSRQVYKGLNLGAGKDLDEYGDIPYHLIDVLEPGQEYSLFRFQKDVYRILDEIKARYRQALLVGGTGLYLDAVVRGYSLEPVPLDVAFRALAAKMSDEELKDQLARLQPDQHNTTDLLNRERTIRAMEIALTGKESGISSTSAPAVEACVLGIHVPRPLLRKRITRRLHERLEAGLIDEVTRLHEQGVSWQTLDNFGLEYRFVAGFLQGQFNRNDMVQKLNSAIHRFAKRQETWFRKMEKSGVLINWLDGTTDMTEQALDKLRASG